MVRIPPERYEKFALGGIVLNTAGATLFYSIGSKISQSAIALSFLMAIGAIIALISLLHHMLYRKAIEEERDQENLQDENTLFEEGASESRVRERALKQFEKYGLAMATGFLGQIVGVVADVRQESCQSVSTIDPVRRPNGCRSVPLPQPCRKRRVP